MLSFNFVLLIIYFVILNAGFSFQISLFSFIPDPLEEMFNASFYQHYGGYLEDFGTATIWSASTFIQNNGSIFGLLVLVKLLDTKGRKFGAVWLRSGMILAVGVLYLLAYFLPSFEAFLLGEFLVGAGGEVKWAATVLFLSECAPDQYRGMTVILVQFGDSLMHLVCQTIDRPSLFGNANDWYLIVVMSLLLLLFSLTYLSWIPESPKFLAENGKLLRAEQSVRFYHGKATDIDTVMDRIHEEVSNKNQTKGLSDNVSFKDVWRDESLRKVTLILLSLFLFFQVSTGAIERLFFVRVHTMMGLSAETVMTISSITKVITLPFYILTAYFVEKVGRRPISLCSVSLSLIKTVVALTGQCIVQFYGACTATQVIAIAGDGLNTMMMILGENQIVSLLCCEMTSPRARVRVMQTVSLCSMTAGMIFASFVPYAFNYFPPLPYFVLLLLQPPVIVYIYRNLPETKGRPVSDIVEDFTEAVRSRAPTRRTTICSEEEKMPLLQ